MTLRLDSFPHCCGIKIVSGFGKTNNSLLKNSNEVKEVEDNLNQIVERERGIAKKDGYGAVGLLMVTLNHEQIPIYQEMMIRCGFSEVVAPFYHVGHESRIAVYTLTLSEVESYGNIESTLKKNVKVKKANATTVKKATKPTATVHSGGNPLDWRWTHE